MNITQSVVSERNRALLGGDYATYHAQATRRIHGLRKKLGTATPRGKKYVPKSPVTAEKVAQNVQWVQLLLASSERAWADAMKMKSSQSSETTQKPMAGSTKKQIASRHRRAIGYATNLVDILSENNSSPGDILEAKAYLALLKGGLNFEKSQWKPCIQNYAISRLIYAALSQKTHADIFEDLLSSTVDPSIKYAAYQSKMPRTKSVRDIAIDNFPSPDSSTREQIESIDRQGFETVEKKAASAQSDTPSHLPTSVTWRSRKVVIEDAAVSQSLGLSYDKENELANLFSQEGKPEKELATAYEDVIDARQEAVDVTKSAIDELRSQGAEQGDMRVQALQVTRTAVTYAVIEWRIGRNRILCGSDDGLVFVAKSLKQKSLPQSGEKARAFKEESTGKRIARLRERVALYDSTLQSFDAIKELPGIAADTELLAEVENKKSYFRALKCLAIGRSQSLNGSIANALALFAKASEVLQNCRPSPNTSNRTGQPIKTEITLAQLKDTQAHLKSLIMQYQALTELKGMNTSKSSTLHSPPLVERFHTMQYDSELDPKNLVNYPPKLQPVPVKPLFFDLAWNYIVYPGQDRVTIEPVHEAPPEPKKGDKKDAKPGKRGWFGFGR